MGRWGLCLGSNPRSRRKEDRPLQGGPHGLYRPQAGIERPPSLPSAGEPDPEAFAPTAVAAAVADRFAAGRRARPAELQDICAVVASEGACKASHRTPTGQSPRGISYTAEPMLELLLPNTKRRLPS